jgi:hypothetical protein
MAPKTVPQTASLTEVLRAGDHRASLEALRDELAAGMQAANANVKPQYAARIQAVLTELAQMPNAEPTQVDSLVERRKARRDAADAGMRAKQRSG